MEQIKIAIADDHNLHTEHAKNFLNRVTDLKVLELIHDGEDLFAYLEHTDELPDVLILDYRMPKFDPIMGIKRIKQDFPSIRIIVLSMIDDPGTICKVIALGASYLIKTVRSAELVNAIRELHTTGKYTSECMKDALIAYKNLDVEDNLYGTDNELTQVERKVLLGICEEYSNAQIAGIIHRSERTVENIRRRISEKVGSKNVVGLIKYAYESGLYRPKSKKK